MMGVLFLRYNKIINEHLRTTICRIITLENAISTLVESR